MWLLKVPSPGHVTAHCTYEWNCPTQQVTHRIVVLFILFISGTRLKAFGSRGHRILSRLRGLGTRHIVQFLPVHLLAACHFVLCRLVVLPNFHYRPLECTILDWVALAEMLGQSRSTDHHIHTGAC